MDWIVIGKRSHNRHDRPHVIYCGQSRDDAIAAVNAAKDNFASFYFINPQPYAPIRPSVVAPAPEPEAETPKPKRRKSSAEAVIESRLNEAAA